MDGERKFTLVVVSIVGLCITILYCFLFISLWHYKELVGLSLLGVLLLSVLVSLRGRLTEQDLGCIRYRHQEETPLDHNGEPLYWHQGYQSNPHRR